MSGSRLDGSKRVDHPATLVLYSRPDCHLCDVAKPLVLEVARRLGVPVVERNVEDDPRWEMAYGTQIPVAFLAGRKLFKYRVDQDRLARQLASAATAD